ncbi:MAG: fasciclin domain-containing protein [Lewinella sp.]
MKQVLPTLLSLCLVFSAGMLTAQDQNVVQIITDSDDHTTLETAIIQAGLDDDLAGDGPFTVFAPTDDAFEMLPEGMLDYLLMAENADSLASVLSYHVVPGDTMSTDLMDGMMLATLIENDSLYVRSRGDSITVNGVLITMADIDATNGVVHVINAVLVQKVATVVDIVVDTDTLQTLEDAVIAAGLDDDLMTEGPFTVFGPSNDAFAAVDGDSLAMLLADPMGNLSTILQYHVVAGSYTSSDLVDGMMLTTLQGESLEVSINEDTIMIDSAMIIMADMMADNGIVHVINGVLLPYGSTSTDEPAFAQDVVLSPNPASNVLNVQLPQSIAGRANLTLRDFSGRTVATRLSAGEREPLNVGNLPAGTYLLEIRADAGVIQRKVMVQH